VLHSTYTHRDWVDSRLLVVGSQIASSTPDPSFNHNLCYRCPNGSREAILDIYASKPFQQYKEHFNARCFDAYNRILSFQKSWRTPKFHFWKCECQLHTSLKVGLRHSIYVIPVVKDEPNGYFTIVSLSCFGSLDWVVFQRRSSLLSGPWLDGPPFLKW